MNNKFKAGLWFVGLWLMGVGAVTVVAFLLKLSMKWVQLI